MGKSFDMKSLFFIPILAGIAAVFLPSQAQAETSPLDPIKDAADADGEAGLIAQQEGGGTQALPDQAPDQAIVGDEELAQQRGGFVYAGVQVNLGAEMRTYLNGDLVLQTTVNWDTSGVTSSQIASAGLSAASMDALRSNVASGGSFSTRIGGGPVYLANQGQTIFAQRTDGALQNVLINTASGQNIFQHVEATLNLSGYQGFQNSVTNGQLGQSLGAAISAATTGVLGN